MVKKMPSRDGNELEDPGCLLRQLEDAAPVVRSVHIIILYAHANPPRRLFEGGVYFNQHLQLCSVNSRAESIRGRRLFVEIRYACTLRFHWPSQIPDGRGVSDKKSHSKHPTLSAGLGTRL